MPAPLLIDLDKLDTTQRLASREQIYELLPHRYEFMQLDAVLQVDLETRIGVALREIREDEFWVRGHIPGRPLFPGVLMLETAAQFAAYLTKRFSSEQRFLAFGGLENVKFRQAVTPPATMYLLERATEIRPRRVVCDAQAIVDGKLVMEATIIGMPI